VGSGSWLHTQRVNIIGQLLKIAYNLDKLLNIETL